MRAISSTFIPPPVCVQSPGLEQEEDGTQRRREKVSFSPFDYHFEEPPALQQNRRPYEVGKIG